MTNQNEGFPLPGRMRMPRILTETQDAIADAVRVMQQPPQQPGQPSNSIGQLAHQARLAVERGEAQQPVPGPYTFDQAVWYECERLARMLISKNQDYGNSAMNPVRIFSDASSIEQLYVRADDKLSRIKNGNFGSRGSAEDALADLAGYIILILIHEGGYKP